MSLSVVTNYPVNSHTALSNVTSLPTYHVSLIPAFSFDPLSCVVLLWFQNFHCLSILEVLWKKPMF